MILQSSQLNRRANFWKEGNLFHFFMQPLSGFAYSLSYPGENTVTSTQPPRCLVHSAKQQGGITLRTRLDVSSHHRRPGTPHGPKLCLSVFPITGHLSEEAGEHLRLHTARPLFVDAFVKRAKNTRQGLNAPSHAFFFFFSSMELYVPLSQPGGA